MALDPLKFAVAIQDEATGQLEKIQREFEKLKDKTVTVNVTGIEDLRNLLSALQHQQVSNLGKEVSLGIKGAAEGLQKEAQDAVRASLGKLAEDLASVKQAIQHDNFTAFSERILKCANAVEVLDAAFKKFHVTIGQDEGMRNFMSGLGEVIRNVRSTMGTLEVGKNGGIGGLADNYERNVQRIEDAMRRVREMQLTLGNRLEKANASGIGTDNRYIYMLDAYQHKLEQIRRDEEVMHGKGWTADNGFKDMLRNADTYIKYLDRQMQKQQTIETNQRRYNTALEEMQKLLVRLDAASRKAYYPHTPNTNINVAIQDVEKFIDKLLQLDKKSFGNNHVINELIAEYTRLKSTMTAVAREQEKLNKTTERENTKTAKANAKQAQKENEQWAESMRRAGVEATKLEIQIRKLHEAESRGKVAKIDTTNLSARIVELQNFVNILRSIENGSRSYVHTGDVVNSVPYQNAIRLAQEESAAVRKAATEKEQAARRTAQLTSEEERLAQAMKQSTQAAGGQSQVLADLKSMAMQYLSVWGGQQFLHNIIEIGGQLEKQRLSISAILGDAYHADELFGKIKNLAIRSPFGVVELDQFTKQLSAYGFKYNELYDMTKRLADIAAGAGTDVSRLTLAIGHVRAEGALTGYTLRQFAMNNIPMVSELAKKLSEVEHRVVTVSDVRKRVSKKEIGYEDVIDVIKNLTNDGGMFYNMQETISQSVQSRFKNLKDSLDIMYGEIAESGIGDALKGVAIALTDLTRNWKSIVPVVESAVMAWSLYKAATIAVNMALGKNTVAVTANMLSYKKKLAEELMQESMVRKLTVEEEALVRTRNRLTASNIRVAMSTGQMTKGEALKLVALRKVDIETTKALVHMGMFSAAEARMALNGRLLYMNLGRVGAALKLFGASAWSSLKSIGSAVFTPLNGFFAALTIGMSAKHRQDEINEAREARRNAISERANEGYKNLMESKANFAVGNSVNMTMTDINLSLDEMMDKLKDYSALYNTTFNNAFKVDEQGYAIHSLAEQYEILAKGIEDAANAHKLFAEMKPMVAHAIETSDPPNNFWYNAGMTLGGWLVSDSSKAITGSLENSLEYLAEKTSEVGIAENMLLRNHLELRNALNNRGLGDVMNMSNQELLQTLKSIRSQYSDLFADVRRYLSGDSRTLLDNWTSAYNSVSEALHIAFGKMRIAGNDLYESMKATFGGDMSKWPSEWREFVFMAMDSATKDVKGFSDMSIDYQNYVRDSFLKPFKISVDTDEAKDKVNNLLTDLENLVGKSWTVKIGVKGESAWDDLETSGKAYQEADKRVKQLEKNLERLNYVPGAFFNSLEAQKVAEEYNDEIAKRRAARLVYESYGGDVSELDKKKKEKTTGEKSYKDKESEVWQQRIKLIQEARREYDYWEKKIGKDAAQEKVKSQFANLIGADKILQPGDLDNLEKYAEVLRKIEEEIKARYEADKKLKSGQKKDTNIANDIKNLRELANALYNIGKGEFERASENFVSKITADIEELTEKWEIFNMVRKATGDVELAGSAAGISPIGDTIGTVADAMRYELMEQLEKAGGEGVVATIPLDVHLDERSIREQLEKAIPLDESIDSIDTYRTKIEGLLKVYQEWQKFQKQVVKDDLQIFSELIGSAVDLQSEVLKIQRKYQDRMDVINRLRAEDKEGKNTQKYDQYEAIAAAARDAELIQATKEYKMLMDGVVTMSENAAETIKSKYIDALKKQFDSGAITAKQYADRIKEINEKTSALRNYKGDFFSFFTGGLEGLFQNKIKRGQSEIEKGALTGDNKLIEIGKDLVETANKQLDRLGFIDKLVHGIDGIVQGSNSIFQNIRKMYDDVGIDTHSNGFSTANIVLSSLSAISNGTTKSLEALMRGDSMGAAAAVTEEATGLVSAIAKEHDDDLSDEIEKLQALADAIEANTEAIKRSRQRLFGYDRGSIGLLTYYRSKYNDDDDVNNAMRDFYKSYGNSGYTKELKNLKDEREKYMEMYNKEADKKDESQTTLEEYKSKIAELDDQIRFFAEDLAKELWSIDIKGWADQFSDALSSAFENGEDMMKAFNDTAKSIMQSVVNEMLKIGIIEPMIENLRNRLFGYTNKDGNFVNGIVSADELTENPLNASKKVLNEIANYFKPGGEGNKMVQVAQEYLTGVDALLQQLGYSKGLRNDDDGSNTLSASIQGTTEETSDLLAGYVNALRQDVAMNRLLLTEFVAQFWPEYNEAFMNHVKAVSRIDGNVQAVMEMMRYGSGALYDEIRALRARVDNVVDGAESFAMR